MANDTKAPMSSKAKWSLVAKLAVGLGALSGGVERYVDLAEKNNLVYQALSTKLNNVSTELAEVKGQNQALMLMFGMPRPTKALGFHSLPHEAPEPVEEPPSAEEGDEGSGDVSSAPMAIAEPAPEAVFSGETMVNVESAEPAPPEEQEVHVEAYQKLPDDLSSLVQQKASGKITRARKK